MTKTEPAEPGFRGSALRGSSTRRSDTLTRRALRRPWLLCLLVMGSMLIREGSGDPSEVAAADGESAKPKATSPRRSPAPTPSAAAATPTGGATHSQHRLIQVVSAQGNEKLTTFAVDAKGRVLAGIAGNTPALRVYDATGAKVGQWALPVPPEAVNVGPKGDVFVAGQGVLLKLDDRGKITLQQDTPNMAGANDAAVGIQKRIQQQNGQGLSAKQRTQIQTYTKRLAEIERKIAEVEHDLVELDKQELGDVADEDVGKIEATRLQLQKRRATCVKLQATLENNIRNPPVAKQTGAGRTAGKAPPEPQAEIKQLVSSQMRIASISASKDEVFLACSSSTGNGFDVWRTDYKFAKAKKIGESLSGCCGQMDVQANDNGIYVAENTRHRVRGFNRDGRQLIEFGSRERGREDGFEGCCNPMNVAFGDDGSVYTAESGSGRIKRFTSNGRFLELVGQVELVPGCKKVSIAVSPDGDQVYMLDITRGHIVVMGRNPAQASAGEPTDSLVESQKEQSVSHAVDLAEAGRFVPVAQKP